MILDIWISNSSLSNMLTVGKWEFFLHIKGFVMNKISLDLPGESITTLRTMIIMDLSSITDAIYKVKINLFWLMMMALGDILSE